MWRRRWWGEPGKTLDGTGRTPGSGSDQAFPDGVADQTGDVVDVQLLHDARAVKLSGFGGDREQRGDLLGRFAFGHELRDLALTRGQPAPVLRRGGPAGIHHGLRDARPHVETAARHLLDGLGEVLAQAIQQASPRGGRSRADTPAPPTPPPLRWR